MLFSVYSGRTIVPRSCRIKRCCNRLPVKQNKKCSDCDCVCLKYDMHFMHLTYPKWDKVGFQEVFGWNTFPSLGIVNSPNSRWIYEVFPDLVSTWPFTKPWISSQHRQEPIEHLNPEVYLDLEESVSWVYKDALVSVCNVFVKTRDKKSTFAPFGNDESFKKQLEAKV